MGPTLLNDIFQLSSYEGPKLRNKEVFIKPSISTVHYGENSLKYLGPKIWSLVPIEIKDIDTLEGFKIGIKKWVPKSCPCKLCKTYVQGLGFVNITE